MSNSNISTRRKQKPPELPEVEGFQSEKIVSLADFSNIDSCNKSLENYIKNIRKLPKVNK